MKRNLVVAHVFLTLMLLVHTVSKAQCPDVYGSFGTVITPAQNPVWIGCGAGTFTIRFQMTADIFGPFTIDWGDGSPIHNGNGLLSTNFVPHTYAPAEDTFQVIFTGTCGTITGLVVMEEAVIASVKTGFGGVTKACAPATLWFTNQSVHNSPTTTYTWDWGDGSPIEVYGPDNFGDTISHTYMKGTVDCETEVALTAENFCTAGNPSQNILRPIQVWDIDSAIIDASETLLCYPDTVVTFRNVSDLNCATPVLGNTVQRYEQWTFYDLNGPGQDSVIGWGPFPISQARTIAFPGPGTYFVQLLDSNQCGIATANMQIVITNPPVANFTGPDTVCEGTQVQFTNLSGSGANSYFWDFGDGNTSTANNPNHTFQTTGLQTIQLNASIAGGSPSCLDMASRNVFVLPAPTADIAPFTDSGCDSLTVAFNDNSSSDAINWFWDFGNGQSSALENPGSIFYNTTGQYTVSLEVTTPEGCADRTEEKVDVYLSPIVQISPNAVCQGVLSNFKETSITAVNDPVITWNWDFGDGTSSNLENPTHVYNMADTFGVVISVSTANCSNTDTIDVIVEPLPVADFALDTSLGCAPLSVLATNLSDSSGTPELYYLWTSSNGFQDTLQDLSLIFSNTGVVDSSYNLSLVAETAFGCRDSISRTIIVFPEVQVAFSQNTIQACNPDSVRFNASASGNASQYLWDFGDGFNSTLEDPAHLYTNDSLTLLNFPVSLEATSAKGCKAFAFDTITIWPKSEFDFAFSPDNSCSPVNLSMLAQPGAVSYKWLINGQTSFGQSLQQTITSLKDSTFDIKLTTLTAFGCRDTTIQQMDVKGGAIADFTTSANSAICAPALIQFTDTSINAATYAWDFGDGFTSNAQSPNHTFYNDSSFTLTFPVQLIVESASGCKDSITRNVQVKPELKIDLTHTQDNLCGPSSINFNASGAANNFQWNFGDGNIANGLSPSNLYSLNADSSYVVTLVGISGFFCSDTISDTIRTRLKPQASAQALSGQAICSPAEFTFENTASLADQYIWDFGDGTTLNTNDSIVNHIYFNTSTQNASYQISLTASLNNGCSDTALLSVLVFPEVIVKIQALQDSICSGGSAIFQVDNTVSNASIYSWSFGNGQVANGFTGNSIYISQTDTVYSIILKGLSVQGCSDSDTFNLRVIPTPVANFTSVYPNPACSPLDVIFQNLSDSSFSYLWNLDNGIIQNNDFTGFQQTYVNNDTLPVSFPISLIMAPGSMCADTANDLITVNPILDYDFTAIPTEGCSPLPVQLNAENGALFYQWIFGDGLTANGQTSNHVYTSTVDTTFNLSLVSRSPYLCNDTTTKIITVHPSATAAINTVQQPVCSPANIDFFNLSDTVISNAFKWSFGDGAISLASTPFVQHAYTNNSGATQAYNIELVAFAPFGCNDTASASINILTQPDVAINTDPEEGCSPLKVDLTAVGNATQYAWNLGDGNLRTGVFIQNIFTNPNASDSTFQVNLIATSAQGCQDTADAEILVFVKPTANFKVDTVIKNLPETTFFITQLSQNANSYRWNFGDGTNWQQGNPADYTFATYGDFNIQMIAENTSCYDTSSVLVTIKPILPVPDFDGAGEGCAPLEVKFENYSQYARSYLWNFGDGKTSNAENPVHRYEEPGVYAVSLVAMNDVDTITLFKEEVTVVYPQPLSKPSFNNPRDSLIYVPGKDVTFRNFSEGATYYTWDFGDGTTSILDNPSKAYTTPGSYDIILVAGNEYNCLDTGYLQLRARGGGSVAIPNAFTPNSNFANNGQIGSSDGTNDIFYPKTDGAISMQMQIFNRWGELIFESKNLGIGWDGYYRGRLCKQDVYVYRINLEFIDGEKRVEIGDVTLLR